MFDVVNGLCFIVDDDVVEWPVCVELNADLINYIWIMDYLLGISSYSRLNLPF